MRPLLHGIGVYSGGAVIGPARWPHFDLIVLTQGAIDFTIAGRVLTCLAGDACLIPPGHDFRGVAKAGGTVIWVQHFRAHAADRRASPLALHAPTVWSAAAAGEWPRALMRQLSLLQDPTRRKDRRLDYRRDTILRLLIDELRERGQTPVDPMKARILSVLEWARTQPLPLPSIETLAAKTTWSVTHFRQRFRAVIGRPVGAVLREMRLTEAARLLRETNRPLKEIAVAAGYGDPVAFHHAFIHHHGMPPARLRRRTSPVL